MHPRLRDGSQTYELAVGVFADVILASESVHLPANKIRIETGYQNNVCQGRFHENNKRWSIVILQLVLLIELGHYIRLKWQMGGHRI